MKSAYELAMERLAKQSPSVKLTDTQKREIADIDSKFKARFAEREIFLKDEIARAQEKGDAEAIAHLERQLAVERKNLAADCEEKKDAIRGRG